MELCSTCKRNRNNQFTSSLVHVRGTEITTLPGRITELCSTCKRNWNNQFTRHDYRDLQYMQEDLEYPVYQA